MKKTIIINGLFFSQKSTGVHRFAKELLVELDKLIDKNEYEIVIPTGTVNVPNYKNLKVTYHGSHKGLLWEQWDYPIYLSKRQAVGLNLCNSQPLLKPGMIAIHDVAYKTHPEYFKTIHGRLSVLWHDVVYKIAAMSKYPIITVSYFSKYSLIDTYKIAPSRIYVVSNGWQHILRIKEDEKCIKKA